MTGLKCEECAQAPDTALAGPFKTVEIAATAMHEMLERDRWERVVGWCAIWLILFGAIVAAWMK